MSQPRNPVGSDPEIRQAEERVADQKELVRRRIVQGNPSQGAEDQLHHLEQALLRAKEQRLDARSSEIRRKLRKRQSA